jgi:hypothetical protein
MPYRNANYTAFYVEEPFAPYGLGACATPDFNNYLMIKAWKKQDPSFPFINAHDKTYSVRDGSDWEGTLRPRLRERLRHSKNIILILSSHTHPSRALNEEMRYGIGTLGLPVIVVYPEFEPIRSNGWLDSKAYGLWNKLPSFKSNMDAVPTVHVPLRKDALREALTSSSFMIQTKREPGIFHFDL